jgi:hypothetical protein
MMTLSTYKPQTIIVGCGVSGLTCGIRLLEKQFSVTIFARELPPKTTSNLAAAVWYPYEVRPSEQVFKWGQVTIDELYQLVNVSDSGVRPIMFMELLKQPRQILGGKTRCDSFVTLQLKSFHRATMMRIS